MIRASRMVGTCLGAAVLLSATIAPAADRAARAREADSLRRSAAAHYAEATFGTRRMAMAELERASLLNPDDHRIWLDLGRLCLESSERRRGRACYEKAKRVAPHDPAAYTALGTAWKWEWLHSFETFALAHAHHEMVRATEVAPVGAEVWSELAALTMAYGRFDEAARAAHRGRAADSSAWQPWVALGCALYRSGALADAEQAFAAARERAPQEFRPRVNRYLPNYEKDDATTEWWRIEDPDLTTPENEAQLDYLTRLGTALLLFRDARGLQWDMRTELFVRYGPPAKVLINPVTSPIGYRFPRRAWSPAHILSGEPPLEYAMNVQAWFYPQLGMRVELWDRTLTQSFQLPLDTEVETDPRPDPTLLANRPDLVALDGGRGVFRSMPPGARPMPAAGQVSRFPSEQGAILVAHLVAAGDPSDTLSGAWAVTASDGTVIARGSGTLSTSACDPAGQRMADFTVAVPPDDYRVDLSVRGTGGRRGLVRLGATVSPVPPGLRLSDLVLLCGLADASVSPEAVRIEPNLARRVSGSEPLAIYFEMDGLTPGPEGRARFAYTTSLRRVEKNEKKRRKGQAAYEATREESHDGARRRQFVTIPLRSVRDGIYDLRIEVRDLIAGTSATAELRFERE